MLGRVREMCLALPEAREEQAWVGTQWRVGRQTFAHVVIVDAGWPPAYARAAGSVGTVVVLTFRSRDPELDVLGGVGYPFFRPPWAPNIVGMVLDDDVAWDEVAELLVESYCVLAPKRLVELVDRPSA